MRIYRKWFQQADKIEWTIIIAALLFLVPSFLQQLFGGFWYSTIAQTIRTVSWIVAVFMAFVVGLRGFRLNGLKGKTKSYLLIGTFLSIFLLGINTVILIVVPKTLDSFKGPEEDVIQLESYLDSPDMDNVGKAYISSFIASKKYQNRGDLVDVFHKDGTVSTYMPTEADINILEGRTNLENQIGEIKKGTFIFVFVLIFSILVGALTPVKKTASISGKVD